MKKMKTLTVLLMVGVITSCNLLNSGNGDGSRTIVFSGKNDKNGVYQIYSMREDGSGVKRLTHGSYSSTAPAWSPDGNQIAYTAYSPEMGGDELWVMDADGKNKQPLMTHSQSGNPVMGSYPAWSPDGNRIAFEQCQNCERGGSNYEIFIADLQTQSLDTLTKHPASDRQPIWSPDGNSIVFESERDYYQADTLRFRHDFYLVNVNTDTLQRLTQTGYARAPVWNRDGTKIIFSSTGYSNGLFQLDLKSSDLSKIEENIPNRLRLFPVGLSESKGKLLITAMDYPEFSFYLLDNETKEATPISFESAQMMGADWFIPTDN